ncbi:MAG: hypothetical protein QOF41_1680 [Methylobacteriaceae bacterium]|nr:hypothetical protein [Methylobacteriaceae bacterium]
MRGLWRVVDTPLMSALAQSYNILAGIEADIADTERFLAEGLTAIIVRLKKGEDTHEAENRVRDIRFTLETLRGLRRQHVRTAVVASVERRPAARREYART